MARKPAPADTLPARSCTCPPGACTRSECVSCRRLAPGEDCHGMAAAAAAMRSIAGIKAEPAPGRQAVTPKAAWDERLCDATTPSHSGGYWICLAADGHQGDHAAYGHDPSAPFHTWPQADPASDTITSDVGTLRPAENLALTVARAQLARGENPPRNTTAMLVATIERLAGIRDYQDDDIADGEL